jgi:putative FmdB family regulatory protein
VPTYQYRCTACDHAFEQFQSFTDDALTVCPVCGGRLRKVFNAVGVVFKGSGFYRNDSRGAASSTDSTSGDKAGAGTSSSTGSLDTASSDSGSSSAKTSSAGSSGSSSAASTSSPSKAGSSAAG